MLVHAALWPAGELPVRVNPYYPPRGPPARLDVFRPTGPECSLEEGTSSIMETALTYQAEGDILSARRTLMQLPSMSLFVCDVPERLLPLILRYHPRLITYHRWHINEDEHACPNDIPVRQHPTLRQRRGIPCHVADG